MDKFQSDVVDNLNPLIWGPAQPATNPLEPKNSLQPLTGSATIDTVMAAKGVLNFTLLAVDGFDLATGGNIAASVTVAPGRAVTIYLELESAMWFVS
jgi:hypothetical protein